MKVCDPLNYIAKSQKYGRLLQNDAEDLVEGRAFG